MTDVGRIDTRKGGQRNPREVALAELATRQYGVVARRQLVPLGLTPKMIDVRLAKGHLHTIHRGVYAVGHRRLTRHGRWMAAVLACGPGAVLSHVTAAALWGITTTTDAPHVTAPRSVRGSGRIVLHRVRCLDARDRTACKGIPVTSVARTLLDLAEAVNHQRLRRAMDEAERLELFDLRAIGDVCQRHHGRRGLRTLKAALGDDLEGAVIRSRLERRFFDLSKAAGLPRPLMNALVEGYEVDAFWPQQRLIVELDSWEFHKIRAAFERDREQDIALQVAGYRVLRVTWRRLTREPQAMAAAIRALLACRPR